MQLREEIKRVQSQLKTAIQNHQMIVFKLKDRPVSTELRVQMNRVQMLIVSLGEKQKKLLQELRKTLDVNGGSIKTEKPFFSSFSLPRPSSVLPSVSLKAMSHQIKKEPIKTERDENDVSVTVYSRNLKTGEPPTKVPRLPKKKVKPINAVSQLSQKNCFSGTPISSPSRKESTPSSTPSSSPTHGYGSFRNQRQKSLKRENSFPLSSASEESQDAFAHLSVDPEVRAKLQFMTGLGLITPEVLAELQSRRTERKRRSTANPQFLYGNNIDHAMKRKKTTYLSSGNAVISENLCMEKKVEQIKLPANSMCLVCSSAKGALSLCSSCHKMFHWSCAFETPLPQTSGNSLKCPACQGPELSVFETNGEKEISILPSWSDTDGAGSMKEAVTLP